MSSSGCRTTRLQTERDVSGHGLARRRTAGVGLASILTGAPRPSLFADQRRLRPATLVVLACALSLVRPRGWAKAAFAGLLVVGLLSIGLGPAVVPALAAPAAMVNLGQASSYAVFSGASVANVVNAPGSPHTTLRGDLGVAADAQPTGFPPGVVTGATRVGSTTSQAQTDLVAAYGAVAGRTGGTAIAGDLIGQTLTPGLYSAGAAVSNTGTVTLDGGATRTPYSYSRSEQR